MTKYSSGVGGVMSGPGELGAARGSGMRLKKRELASRDKKQHAVWPDMKG